MKDEERTMEAGIDLDILVHESTMGGCVHVLYPCPELDYGHSPFPVFACKKCGLAFNERRYENGERLVPAYSTDVHLAHQVLEHFFRGGEALQVSQDLDGQWIACFSHWTNGGKHGPRIWDNTAFRVHYKCPTFAHMVSVAVAGFHSLDEEKFRQWEYNPLKDDFDASKVYPNGVKGLS